MTAPRGCASAAAAVVAAVLVALLTHHVCDAAFPLQQQPSNPVIAHVTMPLVDCTNLVSHPPSAVDTRGGCINMLYVNWLGAVGVRTVPLVWNAAWSTVQAVLDASNGLLLPGGDLVGEDWSRYRARVKPMLQYALDRNRRGDAFPVWGTCQGFQVLATLFANDSSILKCLFVGVEAAMLPLNFTPFTLSGGSTLFPLSAPESAVFASKPVTLNLHSCGVNPADWPATAALTGTPLTMLATNVDANGIPFVSAFESTESLVYGVQFHPERPQFESDYAGIGRTDDDMRVNFYLAMWIRARLRRNNHSFPSAVAANAALVDNCPSSRLGFGKGYYWVPWPAGDNTADSPFSPTPLTPTSIPSTLAPLSTPPPDTTPWAAAIVLLFLALVGWAAHISNVKSSSTGEPSTSTLSLPKQHLATATADPSHFREVN